MERVQFPLGQDFQAGQALKTFYPEYEMWRAEEVRRASFENYERMRHNFLSYEQMQMETHLGERFNVGLSRVEYEIRDGQLYGKDMDKPFIDSMKKGRDIRKIDGQLVDRDREDAEIVGFEKIQALLLNPDTPVGTMMLSVSPKGPEGSSYQKNFYDIFTVYERDGVRYVEARRYASGLKLDEYREKCKVFGGVEIDNADPAASLLANPIPVENTLSAQDLHEYLHNDHEFMDEKTFAIIKKHCEAIAKEFALALLDEPANESRHALLFNAYLNKADEIAERIKKEGVENWDKRVPIGDAYAIRREVEWYGALEVKEVMTGCGVSGGYEASKSTLTPYSVGEYSKDKYGERTFNCPECKKENTRPYNQLLTNCQHCMSAKVAC